MPENVLSSQAVPTRFTGARSLGVTKTVDYEDGGVAIQDPSQGLLYQRWRARLFEGGESTSHIVLDAPSVPEFVALELPGLLEFSFAFDQNMQPTFAYVQGESCYLRWFDTTVSEFVTTTLGVGVITPRVVFDDKRPLGSEGYQRSDVVLAYVRGGALYTRQQRDRYLIEYLQATGVTPLIKIGFTRGLRLQFMHEIL